MKAPEKIYIQPLAIEQLPHQNIVYTKPLADNSIEYTNTDAFIEKALSWLKNHYRDYMHNPTGKRLEAFFGGDMCNDFEEYMKGE